jgi:hypothetical protein
MGILLSIKNQKGKVSVENFKNSFGLRWTYQRNNNHLLWGF